MIVGNKDEWKKLDESFFTTSQLDDYLTKIIEEIQEESEKRVFQECKDTGKLCDTVLIASRSQQQWLVPLIKLGLIKAVLWTDLAEDTVYQVMDPVLRENIIRMNEEINPKDLLVKPGRGMYCFIGGRGNGKSKAQLDLLKKQLELWADIQDCNRELDKMKNRRSEKE